MSNVVQVSQREREGQKVLNYLLFSSTTLQSQLIQLKKTEEIIIVAQLDVLMRNLDVITSTRGEVCISEQLDQSQPFMNRFVTRDHTCDDKHRGENER